jgi:O-antigen/teichoic acid export membrane protein
VTASAVLSHAARLRTARPRLAVVDRRGAALLSIGTLASGLLAYAFNVLAARSLGPGAYGAVGALWGSMFLLAVLLFRPLEQTLSRAVADQVARGADARPAVRSAAMLGFVVLAGAMAILGAAWEPLTTGLFGGRDAFTAALMIGVAGYAASYFVRGLAGGVRWFEGYGLLLLADGGVRLVLALPLLFLPWPTIAAVAIALAAGGGALAPLLSRRRSALGAVAAERRTPYPLGRAVRFALPVAVIAGCEQVLISGGPLLILVEGGPGAPTAAGVLFAATLLVRAPVFVFQGIAASLLPNLTTFQARGDLARVHRATLLTAGAMVAFALVVAACALAFGQTAMSVLYGEDFEAGRLQLTVLALGIGAFLAASTFSQALLARGLANRAALYWGGAAVAFVALELLLPGTAFNRVAVAFAGASGIVAALCVLDVWRGRP